MAITAFIYGNAVTGQYSGTAARRIDWVNDTINVALVAAAYTPDQDAHTFWSDVSANEVTGTNWSAGGVALTGKTAPYDAATNRTRLKAGATSVANVTAGPFRYAVVYKSTGTGTTSPLISYVDFGGNQQVTSGTLTITWDATDGVAYLAPA